MSAIEELGKKTVIDMTDLEYAVWNLHTTESGDIGEKAAEELHALQEETVELASQKNLTRMAGELNGRLQGKIEKLEYLRTVAVDVNQWLKNNNLEGTGHQRSLELALADCEGE